MILIIREPAIQAEMSQMRQEFEAVIKLAVDVRRAVLAGGGALHADCEQALLQDGSLQEEVWGADWYPDRCEVGFESIINIRPRQQNFGLEVKDPALRRQIEEIVRRLLGVG